MKRLVISMCALVLSVTVVLASPGSLAAAPPPPCPDGQTFQFCERECPVWLDTYCLDAVFHPAGCRVVNSWCEDFGWQGYDCYGNVIDPEVWPPELVKNAMIWCTYQDGY